MISSLGHTVTRVALLVVCLNAHVGDRRVTAHQQGIAYLALDLTTKKAVTTVRPDLLDTPVLPGSVVKIATLAAALESGVINERTGIACARDVTVAGHRLTCSHVDLHRPLRPDEALAHSCNSYFAAVAARLPRASLDNSLRALGLPPSDPSRPLVAAALGVEAIRATPRQLLDTLTRVAADPSALGWRPGTLASVREGLRGAAKYGTASALADRGVSAMAKTGTTVAIGDAPQGIVVGVTPASRPTIGFVLLASGAGGAHAAALAAERLAPQTQAASELLRIGVARPRNLRGESAGYDVRAMPVEEYVAGVVTGEAAPGSAPAALEALAIAVRTFALANRGRHAADGFDLCDVTHCQVLRNPTQATGRAAATTSGRVLLDRGKPASIFYTAACGGHSEKPSALWPESTDPAFLPSRPDAACNGAPAWSADLTAANLVGALRAAEFKGDSLRDLRVISRNQSGRAAWLRLDGLTPDQISGDDLRTIVGRTLGWQHIRSTMFDLRRTASGYHFDGRGAGHGVGLCVIGSANLAAGGQSADVILSRYFPGLQISPLSTAAAPTARPDVAIVLSAAEQDERSALYDFTVRARDALAARLGVSIPPRMTLRFHPTIESYQRATGQPWFTAGATAGQDAHFPLVAVLRERGLLERTIKHELVHILTRPTLTGRPLWVQEGAAVFFATDSVGAIADVPANAGKSVAGSSCPSDREIRQPSSAQALGTAYSRAVACFARQIESGKRWSEVR